MPNGRDSAVAEPILPVTLGKGNVRYARGMRAGRWVFATGHMGQDFEHGMAPDVLAPRLPHAGRPKREKEAAVIFDRFEAVVEAAGASLADIVRTDQYYTTVDAVPPYQAERRGRFGRLIPPSTSITMHGFSLPGADMNVQAIAVVPEDGFTPKHLSAEGLEARPTSGYSPALVVGDFVFVPGITAMAQPGEPARNAIADTARIEHGMQWGGQPIKLETEFIISERIKPSLEIAGSSLADVVKAQVYLTDPRDYSAFNEAWIAHFGDNGPALSIIPCRERGLAVEDGSIEINVLALASGGATRKEIVSAGVFPGFRDQVQAVRAGDLLFLSGLMAIDENGLVGTAEIDSGQPHYQSSASAQAECIIANAEKLCAAAGTSLANVVRVQQFHTDIAEFYPVHRAWQRHLGDRPLPFTAVEVPSPLPVPGATLLVDLWVYAP
jgi:enamine deaminase RidA (YjgF/YER057c/UK114 family)